MSDLENTFKIEGSAENLVPLISRREEGFHNLGTDIWGTDFFGSVPHKARIFSTKIRTVRNCPLNELFAKNIDYGVKIGLQFLVEEHVTE